MDEKKELRCLMHKSNSAKVVMMIEVNTTAGDGSKENPTRAITEYWTLEGELLTVLDPLGTQGRCIDAASSTVRSMVTK